MTEMRDISREGILLAGAGRALLLQLANPAVGGGVVHHSNFASDPLSRLHGTLSYIYAVASGSEADAAAMRRAVNRAHVPVRGPGYTAMDPALQLWVAATLYDTALQVHELVFGPLPDDTAERVYREYAVLGTALQMPAELWPADRAAFRAYFAAQQLSVDAEVKRVQETLLSASTMPFYLRPLLPTVRFVTAGLLPERVRELYGFSWSPADAQRFARLVRRAARVYRSLPGVVRHWPQRHYLRRLRAS